MNIDRFLAEHRPAWDRLAALSRAAARDPGRLSPAELRELVKLYHRTATHLSVARTRLGDDALVARLSSLVSSAGAVVHGTRPRTLTAVRRFVTHTFPAAVWHDRWALLVAAAAFVVPALLAGTWFATSPTALDLAIPPALQQAYVEEDFTAYYTATPPGQFFAEVGFNNIQVGIVAFVAGIALGLGTVLILLLNAVNVGTIGGLFHAFGVGEVFWGFITPHGLLELTAVFVAGGAGIAIGWSLVAPGDRWRRDALVEETRRAVVIVIGLVPTFAVAAVIEAFVTGSALPTWARVGIGVVVWLAFLAHVLLGGRAAAAQGLSGTLAETDVAAPGHSRPVALTSR